MIPPAPPRPLRLRIPIIPGESLNGFLLRLAERNGREHPRQVLGARLSSLFPGYRAYDGELAELAVLSGRSAADLAQLLAEDLPDDGEHGPGALQYGGQVVTRSDLLDRHRQFCPSCLAEAPYQRLKWDLIALGDCARHGVKLVSQCPSRRPDCPGAVQWDRCGTTACACGAPFTEIAALRSDPVRYDLAAWIEDRMDGRDGTGPPLLADVALHRAIAVMLLLGNLRFGSAPWRPRYHPRMPDRHDYLALGFGLSWAPMSEQVELVGRAADLVRGDTVEARVAVERYGWMATAADGNVRELGRRLLQACGLGDGAP